MPHGSAQHADAASAMQADTAHLPTAPHINCAFKAIEFADIFSRFMQRWNGLSIGAVQSSKYNFISWKLSWNENALQSIVLMSFFIITRADSIKIAYAAKQQEDALSDSTQWKEGIATK